MLEGEVASTVRGLQESDDEFAGSGEILHVTVSTNMLTVDVNVWHGVLTAVRLEGSMDGVSVGDLIKLDCFEIYSLGTEEILGLFGEWAVGLRVNHHLVLGNVLLDSGCEGGVDHIFLFS